MYAGSAMARIVAQLLAADQRSAGRYNRAMVAHDFFIPPEITPDSPCIGHCTTVLGDDICRSCLRTLDEITRWVAMSETERRAVNLRIATLPTTGFPPARE